MYVKECSFVSNTWKKWQNKLKMNFTNWKCIHFVIGCPYFLQLGTQKVLNLCHAPHKSSRNQSGIVWQVCNTACLFTWRLSVCTLSFDGFKSPLLKKFFSDLNLYKAVRSSALVVHLKLKSLLMKPTHDDIIKAKEVYSQLSFER